MKIVIAGGAGQLGQILARDFHASGDEVVVLSRVARATPWRTAAWDARTPGDWIWQLNGADAMINLAGASVNCRYTPWNRRKILESRLLSTRIIGDVIARSERPPRVWLQASTATIYSHRFDEPNDEMSGLIGGSEPDAPRKWLF